MRTWVTATIALVASFSAVAAQDLAAGEASYKKRCFACHAVGENAKTKLGPPLNGLDGRKAGSYPGYSYSAANKDSGIVWNEESFRKYIRAPMQEMRGTKMAFVGIKDEKEITDLWAFLKQFDGDGQKK
jgi:cytochrome c